MWVTSPLGANIKYTQEDYYTAKDIMNPEELTDIVMHELLSVATQSELQTLNDFLVNSTYLIDPASVRNHSNFPYGLCYHSWLVRCIASCVNRSLGLGLPEMSIIKTAYFHDLCKVGTYVIGSRNIKNAVTGAWNNIKVYKFVDPGHIAPHGVASAMKAQQLLHITAREFAAIAMHMATYDYTDERAVQSSFESNLLSPLIHYADTMAATFFEIKFDDEVIPWDNPPLIRRFVDDGDKSQ